MRTIQLISLVLLTFSVEAEWFSGSGTAVIFENNRALARQQAARQALRNVLIQAEVSLAALDLFRQEELFGELFTLHSSVPISQIIIQEEYERDGQLSITLKADVWPQANLCNDRNVAKALLLTPFSLAADSAQVGLGNIELTKEINTRFASAIQRSPADFLIKAVTPVALFPPEQYQKHTAIQQLRSMSDNTQTQFIVSGRIRNLSFGRNPGRALKSESWIRQFALEISLLEGASGLLIHTENYQTRTLWPHSITTQVDAGSDQLWRSDFGIELQRLINEAVDDLAKVLSCVRVKAQVIRMQGNTITISAGSRQGLKPGDIFSLLYSNSFTDSWGNNYTSTEEAKALLEVFRVYPDHAEARLDNQHYLVPVSIRDQVQQHTIKERYNAN